MKDQKKLLLAIVLSLQTISHLCVAATPPSKQDVELYLRYSGSESLIAQNVENAFRQMKAQYANDPNILAMLTATNQEQVKKDQRQFLINIISRSLTDADIKYLNEMYKSSVGARLQNFVKEMSNPNQVKNFPTTLFAQKIASMARKPKAAQK